MYLTQVNRLRNLDKETYKILRSLCKESKNLYNCGVYNVRQYYFKTGQYLNYYENYHLLKHNEHYRSLVQCGQCVLRAVDVAFKSFFALIRLKKDGKDLGKVKLPGYLEKDNLYPVIFQPQMFRIIDGKIRLSMTRYFKEQNQIEKKFLWFKFPKHIDPNSVKEIKIIPHYKGLYFTIHITYKKEVTDTDVDKNNILGIDLGVNNFAACIDNLGSAFLLDGKYIKSINQGYNKIVAKLKSILDKSKGSPKYSKRLYRITTKRNNRIEEVMRQYVSFIIKYCLERKIGTVVIGDLRHAQNSCNMGKKINQSFVQIPYGKFTANLKSKCELFGIDVQIVGEQYTSKCSALDSEPLKKQENYCGKRISRGLFKTKLGYLVNADINGAASIVRKFLTKSKQNLETFSFQRLFRGLVNRPVRIRYHQIVSGTNFSQSLGACLQGN